MVREMRQYPKPQEIYRHFKGNCYQILTLARSSETGERMVVYQQLYAPYEVYVRPLEMFMSKVDVKKYPNETQKYRFERLKVREQDDIADHEELEQQENRAETKANIQQQEPEEEIDLAPELLAFLDADSYERKLEILSALHPKITDEMIDTMAVSLDTEIKAGDIEQRYNEIKNCLITMERFECNRLR